jgi:mannitol-1-/sugar-/sorbitol-6-phosphatase
MPGRIVRLFCQAILFDLDGVLVDSTASIEEAWRLWAVRHGLDPEDVLRVAHGRRGFDTVRLVAPHLDAAREVAEQNAHEARATGFAAAPGAQALIEQLPPSCWAVVTSGVRAVAEHRLRTVGLPIPRVMVCADEVVHGKPDPEGFLAAAVRLGVPPSTCVVIEDAPAGLDAAHAAGMPAVAVASTYPPDALHMANIVVNSLEAVTVQPSDRGKTHRLRLDAISSSSAAHDPGA